MAALKNIVHETFCRVLFTRLVAGEDTQTARLAAYNDVVYRGDNPDRAAPFANARRLSNRPEVKARLDELLLRAPGNAPVDPIAEELLKLDPLILDVLRRLPSPGSVWPHARRHAWVRLLEESFDVVYAADDVAAAQPAVPKNI
jgi:hypothetical protein